MADFVTALEKTLQHEGSDFVDDPHDKGGATRFGITLNFYQETIDKKATSEDIKNLTPNTVGFLYHKYFWEPNRYQLIDSQKIANKIFDLCVNIGPHANKMLQQAINMAALELTVKEDGIIGSQTIAALNKLSEDKVYSELIEEALQYYTNLVKNNPDQHVYLEGWLHRLES